MLRKASSGVSSEGDACACRAGPGLSPPSSSPGSASWWWRRFDRRPRILGSRVGDVSSMALMASGAVTERIKRGGNGSACVGCGWW
jgi:hypothetical protein